jgi:hypothetical protein
MGFSPDKDRPPDGFGDDLPDDWKNGRSLDPSDPNGSNGAWAVDSCDIRVQIGGGIGIRFSQQGRMSRLGGLSFISHSR